ncbi:MAG TPA: hypothetical protein VIK86_07880 [Candidatus Paceibacterota bacterium]
MENIIKGEHIFEVVTEIPYGYTIWNIGKNMNDGYLPLCQVGGYNGCQVNISTLKALEVKEAQTILAAIGYGQKTIKDMQNYIDKNNNYQAERFKKAIEIMKNIKGIQKLQ